MSKTVFVQNALPRRIMGRASFSITHGRETTRSSAAAPGTPSGPSQRAPTMAMSGAPKTKSGRWSWLPHGCHLKIAQTQPRSPPIARLADTRAGRLSQCLGFR